MDKPKKIYYTMGEVAEIFDVNCSLIRFWEKKFDILKPHKNNKGNRLFTPEDLENLKLIYHLVKENGMTLAGAQKRLKDNREGIERNIEIVEKLQRMRAMLMEVKQELKIEDGVTQYISSEPLDMGPSGVTDVASTVVASTVVATCQSDTTATMINMACETNTSTPNGADTLKAAPSEDATEAVNVATSDKIEVQDKVEMQEVTKPAPLLMAIEQTLF